MASHLTAIGVGGTFTFERVLVGEHPTISKLRALAERVASSDVTVLITGESGTGKEVVAKAIHAISSRSDRPFVPVNCAAIPRDLLESEMFGHERGAFTGAAGARHGLFTIADGGTIFLDEIGEMPSDLQNKAPARARGRDGARGGVRSRHARQRSGYSGDQQRSRAGGKKGTVP